jgi:membrane-associated protease RseP (regulator of RpoE activity)
MLVRRHMSIGLILFLCQLLLIRCGTPDRAGSPIGASTPAYPAVPASIYPAPTSLPSYPAPTNLPVLAVTVIVDPPSPSLGIVYNQSLEILAVDANSPAAHAMLQAGDHIREVNDQAFSTPEAFRQVVHPLLTSATFTITVERSGSILQRTIIPGWLPETEVVPSIRSTATPVPPNLYYR